MTVCLRWTSSARFLCFNIADRIKLCRLLIWYVVRQGQIARKRNPTWQIAARYWITFTGACLKASLSANAKSLLQSHFVLISRLAYSLLSRASELLFLPSRECWPWRSFPPLYQVTCVHFVNLGPTTVSWGGGQVKGKKLPPMTRSALCLRIVFLEGVGRRCERDS